MLLGADRSQHVFGAVHFDEGGGDEAAGGELLPLLEGGMLLGGFLLVEGSAGTGAACTLHIAVAVLVSEAQEQARKTYRRITTMCRGR